MDKVACALEQDSLPSGDQSTMAFKGTLVAYGRGSAMVVATVMQTEWGRIARMLQKEETLTPLPPRMTAFGKKLSILVLFLIIGSIFSL